MSKRTHLDYTMTLARTDGSVVKTITIPVTTLVAGRGNASSRLSFPSYDAEQQLRADLGGLASVVCKDANDRATAAQDATPEPDPQTKTPEQERRERDQTVASRLDILWNVAIHWPAKYRNAIEACLVADEDFDRVALQRSVK